MSTLAQMQADAPIWPFVERLRLWDYVERTYLQGSILSFGVAGPGANDAVLSPELVALPQRLILGMAEPRGHRIAVRTAGIVSRLKATTLQPPLHLPSAARPAAASRE